MTQPGVVTITGTGLALKQNLLQIFGMSFGDRGLIRCGGKTAFLG